MPASEPARSRPGVEPEGPILYSEDGWSWVWILAAPLFCAGAALFELLTGAPVHWLMLLVCAVASALCHGVMIAATRVHGRVRLTPTVYIQGTEELELERVEQVLPLYTDDDSEASWETARTLGELREVPRRRGSVGLRLDTGGEVRAWCRKPPALHAALVGAVGAVGAVGDECASGVSGGSNAAAASSGTAADTADDATDSASDTAKDTANGTADDATDEADERT